MTFGERVGEILVGADPVRLNITVNRLLPIPNKEALEDVFKAFFKKICEDVVDHSDRSTHVRCGETYADIILALRTALPDEENHKTSFTRILLDVCQDTFEDEAAKD